MNGVRLCVSAMMVNGHSSSTASTAHIMTAAAQQGSKPRAEPTNQHQFQPQQQQRRYCSVDSARTSKTTTSSCSSLSHDDHLSTEMQVWHMSLVTGIVLLSHIQWPRMLSHWLYATCHRVLWHFVVNLKLNFFAEHPLYSLWVYRRGAYNLLYYIVLQHAEYLAATLVWHTPAYRFYIHYCYTVSIPLLAHWPHIVQMLYDVLYSTLFRYSTTTTTVLWLSGFCPGTSRVSRYREGKTRKV